MDFRRFVLKNGLRVILVPIREVESATTLLLVGAGSRYEKKEKNGLSHFLEHMAFKGTKKRPTALEIATLVDSIGAEQNAFTSKEYTGYYIKSSKNHIETALDVLSDMIQNSLLLNEEIERERKVILEELNLYEDTPSRKIGDLFERLLFGDSPLGWETGGEKDTVRNIRREDFVDYLGRLYSSNNMALVIAGNIDKEETQKKIESYFSNIPQKKKIEFYFGDVLRFEVKGQKGEAGFSDTRVFLKSKETEQAHFAIGARTCGLKEEERYPLLVLSAVLGGGMSSRLFYEVRERRGLAYYVRSLSENFTDTGYLVSVAGVDPNRVEEAIKVVLGEYEKVCSDAISDEELSKAKEFLKGHFVLDLEDTKAVASLFATEEILEEEIQTPMQIIEKINKVQSADVLRVAKSYLEKSRLHLAVIGNFPSRQRFENLIG